MRRRSGLALIAFASLGLVPMLRGVEPVAAPNPDAGSVSALRLERVEICKQAIARLDAQIKVGLAPFSERAKWEKRLFEAETAAASNDAERIAAAGRFVESCRKQVERAQSQFDAAVLAYGDVQLAKYELAGAQCAMAELKAK